MNVDEGFQTAFGVVIIFIALFVTQTILVCLKHLGIGLWTLCLERFKRSRKSGEMKSTNTTQWGEASQGRS